LIYVPAHTYINAKTPSITATFKKYGSTLSLRDTEDIEDTLVLTLSRIINYFFKIFLIK